MKETTIGISLSHQKLGTNRKVALKQIAENNGYSFSEGPHDGHGQLAKM